MGERVDPITVSVIQHRLEAIVQEMGEAMLRTSYSQILNSSRDFSTALCDAEGRLVAQAEHVPIHVGAIPWAVRSVREFFGDRVRRGDVYLLNDPYHGNNHLPDLTAFVPVFSGDQLVFWSVNRSHQSDIGGATHGAYNPGATEIWQEGLRITPLRLYEAGVVRDDVLKMIATNVRHPRDFQGDLAAMIGSARVGERRLLALLDEYGAPIVGPAIEAILDGAERQTRACIAAWKDGVYRGEAVLDDDGHGFRDIHIRATVTKRGSDLTVDLTDSHRPGDRLRELVLPEHALGGRDGARVPHRSRDAEERRDVPPADGDRQGGDGGVGEPAGAVDPLHEPLRPGDRRGRDQGARPGVPGRARWPGWGRRFRIAIQGTDPRSDRPFIWHMFHARPGGGASPAGDGWPTAGEGQAAGGIKFGSVEVTEVRFPLFFARHEFRPDSGGDGRYRGGVGSVLELRAEIAAPARANTAGDGTRHAPYGILGGKDGLPHRYRLRSRGRPDRVLKTKEVGVVVRPGDVFLVESGGGGGYGDPRRRLPEARAYDQENGFVTRGARARAAAPARGKAPARRAKAARPASRKGR